MMMMEQVDPLSNPVILEAIFKNLNASDLKAVRLVSSLWKETSLDAWRKTAVLVLTPPDGGGVGGDQLTLSQFKEMISDDDWGWVGDHQHAHLKLRRKPFSNYKLVGWNIGPEEDESSEEEQGGFLRDHGSLMKYLHLDPSTTFSSLSVFQHLLTRRLPNLKKLVWSLHTAPRDPNAVPWPYPNSDSDDDDDDAGDGEEDKEEVIFNHLKTRLLLNNSNEIDFHQASLKVLEIHCSPEQEMFHWESEYWTELLYCMPAVEDVTLRMNKIEGFAFGTRSWAISMLPFLRGLRWLRRLGRGSKIRKLDVMDFFRNANSVFGGSCNLGKLDDNIFEFPLEELSFDWGIELDDVFNKKVLENLSDSLHVLKAFRAPKHSPQPLLPLPGRMDSLRELYLYGNVTENLVFLHHTPNLKVLVMNQFCFEQRHKLETVLLAESRYVRFCASDDLVSNTGMALVRFFKISEPSLIVTSLEYFDVDYPVSAAAVPTLAKWLPNVKTLKMVMDNESLSAACKVWPKVEEIECLFKSSVDDDGFSSLIQCSELRKFKMNSLCGHATLTSSSLNQFLKVNSLRELDICTSDKVSDEAESKLLGKLRVVKLIRNHDANLGYECCERTPFLQKVFDLAAANKRFPAVFYVRPPY